VIIHHVEAMRSDAGLANHAEVSFVRSFGGGGVTLFFVLSGFLITYLLLEERAETGTIRIRDFYLRRVLRIWPLYYLLVGLGFFVFPRLLVPQELQHRVYDAFGTQLALYGLLMPNVAFVHLQRIPLVSHLWSVGSEEQFYLAWPVLVRLARDRVVPMLAAVIAVFGVLRWGFSGGPLGEAIGRPALGQTIGRFLHSFRVDCMAIGGLGAVLLRRPAGPVLRFAFHPAVQVGAVLVLLALIADGGEVPLLHHQVHSLLFLVVILNVSSNPRRLASLENAVFRFLGRISYGLYMYHPAAIAVVLVLLAPVLPAMGRFTGDVVVYAAAFGLTTAVAAASYRWFESPFLRLKRRFATIATGDEPGGAPPR
jgi:peptidoglycan/LPS O-acetylase OafA/YrhL